MLVAGAGGGLGSAAAVAAAAAGATVVLLGRKPRRLDRVYAQVQAVGPEPLLYPLDLEGAGPDDYAELAQALQRELGRLDGVLVCAAHFPGLTPFELADPASFARAVHVTLTAPAWLAQACLPLLRQRDDAALVFAVDASERVGQAYWGGYGVAQHGLRGLIASLHDELGRSPVRVSGLYPGPCARRCAPGPIPSTRTRPPGAGGHRCGGRDPAVRRWACLAGPDSRRQ